MDTRNNIAFFFCFAFILLTPHAVAASVVISEIMYDAPGTDIGHEWIEIFNDGADPISLEGWRLLENGTKHKLTSVSSGNTVQPGGYAIIADKAESFHADFPAFGGQLFDSAFSLSNTGETLGLLDGGGATISSVTYQASAGAGNSLNKSGSDFVARTPTPGAAMSANTIQPPQKEIKTARPQKEKVPAVGDAEITADQSREAEIVPETPELVVAAAQQTAPAVFSRSSIAWWVAAAFIALAAAGALLYARSLRKGEWNIIEETG
ncbi:MAG TPA: lamin tail domain-containing protein [Candidatus Paceibacterota bacterium]